jgi:membrane protease YdiL (CAAX protease family)
MSATVASPVPLRRRLFDLNLVRVALYLVVLFGAYIGLQVAVQLAALRLPKTEHSIAVAAGFIGLGLPMVVLYAVLVRVLERRKVLEIKFAPLLWIGGIALGAALFVALYVALWFQGVARFAGFSADAAVLSPFAIELAASFGEEVTFRGGVFRVLEDTFGTLPALVVSAAAFGLVHAFNPGANAVSTTAIALEAGVLLGLAYAATRSLWFPIGLHFGWGFAEGGVFGAAISGHGYQGLLHVPLAGPDLLTGGAFGPEASIEAVGISLVASLVLAVVAFRTGRWKPLTLRMRMSGA